MASVGLSFSKLGCISQILPRAPVTAPARRTRDSSGRRGACEDPAALLAAARPRTPRTVPFVWSPWSFFLWDRPVLLALDQEKKAPFRLLSPSSSAASSFRDRPDLDFPLSCRQTESGERGYLGFQHWHRTQCGSEWGRGCRECPLPAPPPAAAPPPPPKVHAPAALIGCGVHAPAAPIGCGARRYTPAAHRAAPPRPGTAGRHLFWRGHVGVVRADAVLGGRAAGHLLGVGEGAALHLRQDALLVQRGLQEARVAVELHQVENLRGKCRAVDPPK